MTLSLKCTPDNRCNLHIYRFGTVYEADYADLFTTEWTTIRHTVLPYPRSGPVHHRNVAKGLDAPANSFDAAYVFHVLEHLPPPEADCFLRELHRMMKPGTILRISSPDIAHYARIYLDCLAKVQKSPDEPNLMNYEWACAHLYDQMVRRNSGGMMLELIRAGRLDEAFMRQEFGDVFNQMRKAQSRHLRLYTADPLTHFAYRVWRKLYRMWHGDGPTTIGEQDAWAYDPFSLERLVQRHGFCEFRVLDFKTSQIANWSRYNFDSSKEGDYAHEPSMYVECRRDSGS